MRQRKSLDLNSKVSLEAIISDDGRTELNFRVAKKDYRIAGEEIQQLRDWLTEELLDEPRVLPMTATEVQSLTKAHMQAHLGAIEKEAKGPVVEGPLAKDDPQAKAQGVNTDMDSRRAISSSPRQPITLMPTTTKADDLRVHNLSGQISSKAGQAFSKEGLSTFEPS